MNVNRLFLAAIYANLLSFET